MNGSSLGTRFVVSILRERLVAHRVPSAQDYAKMCDGALTAFRRCVREIASSQTLQLVTNVEAIHKKFGQGKYRTKLGFGLHFGWSVEGPVGTPTKIDCSYLSPEVYSPR